MSVRVEKDSFFLDYKGKENVRLDLYPRDQPLDTDLIITGMQVTNLEDETSDLTNGYFRAHLRQDDGSWKEMHGDDFTYDFQRAVQPQMDKHGQAASGPWFCEMHHEYRYTYIPLHRSRTLQAELFKKN